MALSLQSQWKLVAAGLMAHADQVMAGEECERLMFLVEADVADEEYAPWLAIVSDPERLEALLSTLPPLAADAHRPVLEEAWLMAVVDGVRHEKEVDMLARLGAHLGVEPVQLDFWRQAWTQTQSDRAETTIRILSTLLDGRDAPVMESVLFDLPTTAEHRDALRAISACPQTQQDVVRRLIALPKALRRDIVQRLREAAEQATDRDAAAARLLEVAQQAGVPGTGGGA